MVRHTQEVVPVEKLWEEEDPDKCCGASDGREAEETPDENLGASLHVERLDHEDRQYPEDPIASAIDNGRGEIHAQHDLVFPAFPGGSRRFQPPGARRVTLKHGHEEVARPADADPNHDDAQNPDVESRDGDSEEEQADSNLE